MDKKRVIWVDTLKGILIILVVIGHVADGYINANLYAENSHILNFIFRFIYSFHMPAFFFISGYVFKLSYIDKNLLKKEKIKKQIVNLIYLYLMFSIIQWGFKIIFSSYVNTTFSLNDLLNIFIKPMAPYWYLYDLIIFYLIMLVLKDNKNKYKILIIMFVLDLILIVTGKFYFIENKLHYFIFFYFGMYISDFLKLKNGHCIILFICTVFLTTIYSLIDADLLLFEYLIAAFFSIILCCSCKLLGNNYNIFSKIGTFCLDIYVFHCYITAGNRLFFKLLHVNNFYVSFVLNSILGVLLPILFAIFMKKIKLYDYVMRPVYVRRDKK